MHSDHVKGSDRREYVVYHVDRVRLTQAIPLEYPDLEPVDGVVTATR
jgi:hypothetical protein